MVQETIFQHWIFTQFAFPFLLIWTLVFALLGKTKLLGDNKQIDSIVAFVIAFVFIGAAYPKDIVHNLVLFLTVAIVIVFVGLLLWGFASGSDLSKDFLTNNGVKWVTGFGIFIAVTIAEFCDLCGKLIGLREKCVLEGEFEGIYPLECSDKILEINKEE